MDIWAGAYAASAEASRLLVRGRCRFLGGVLVFDLTFGFRSAENHKWRPRGDGSGIVANAEGLSSDGVDEELGREAER